MVDSLLEYLDKEIKSLTELPKKVTPEANIAPLEDLDFLVELIDKETASLLSMISESQSFDAKAAWDAIPLPQISELGWADPKKEGGKLANEQRRELAGYLKGVRGTGMEKIANLAKYLENPEKRLKGKSLSQVLSYLTFYKTMSFVIANFNPSTAGFLFESVLGVVTGGQQIAAAGGDTIADFSFKIKGENEYISLKLLTEGGSDIEGSFFQLTDDMVSKGKMKYVVALKNLEEGEGIIDFYEFVFNRESFLRLSNDSDSGKQNLRCLKGKFQTGKSAPIGAAHQYSNWNEWLVSKGYELMTFNGIEEDKAIMLVQAMQSGGSGSTPPSHKSVASHGVSKEILNMLKQQFGKDKEDVATSMRPVQKVVGKAKSGKEKLKIDEDSFMTYEESIDFLNEIEDERSFWEALQDFSMGYIDKRQFSFTQSAIKKESGGKFATLTVGVEEVQRVLNAVISETNEKMFKIFQTLQVLSTSLREFFMKKMDETAGNEAKNAARRIHDDTRTLVKGSQSDKEGSE